MTFGESYGVTCSKCFAFVPRGKYSPVEIPEHVCMVPTPTVPASLLHERDTTIEILTDDLAKVTRERDLLVTVARRAQGLLVALDDYDGATDHRVAPVMRRQLREALDAWGEDETKGGGE